MPGEIDRLRPARVDVDAFGCARHLELDSHTGALEIGRRCSFRLGRGGAGVDPHNSTTRAERTVLSFRWPAPTTPGRKLPFSHLLFRGLVFRVLFGYRVSSAKSGDTVPVPDLEQKIAVLMSSPLRPRRAASASAASVCRLGWCARSTEHS